MKKVWITSLVRDEKKVADLMGMAKKYGLDANGHFWVDDMKHMAWKAPVENLIDHETTLWMIMGSEKDLEAASVRYGLGLLALTVQAKKGLGFHIIWISAEGKVDAEKLPTPLKGVEVISASDTSIGAKLVAKANTPAPKIDTEYRLDIHANPGVGVWIEIGPAKGHEWNGALLGVNGGEIDAHGVGPAGKLPRKAVLEYQMQGLKLKLGEDEYTAWAVQNRLDENSSYYARVQEIPKTMIFGPYAQDEEADVHVIQF